MTNITTSKLLLATFSAGCLFLFMPWEALGQVSTYDPVYRPAEAQYRVLQSEHFEVIYQDGAFDEAAQTAAILEETLPRIRELAGLPSDYALEMPVLVNAYSDRARGLLSPAPFRQEMSHTGVRNDIFPPGMTNWFNLVAPHELMHAAHAEIDPPIGVGWFMRRTAPDWARGLNLSISPGMTEGIAVFKESEVEEGGGRLNQPLFESRFLAAMDAGEPWSMAQIMERTRYSWPFDRHYVGGGYLYSHLYEQDEGEFFRRSTRTYNRFPFLGYGVTFGLATGQWPSSIHSDLLERTRTREGRPTSPFLDEGEVIAENVGSRFHRPLWEDNETLVAYGLGYAKRPGFYRIDLTTGERSAVSIDGMSEDRYARLSEDRSTIYFARYTRDTWSPLKHTSDVYALSVDDGETTQITDVGQLTTPFEREGELYAFRIDGDRNHLVRINSETDVEQLTNMPGTFFREAVYHEPSGATYAVVNIRGKQALVEIVEQEEEWGLAPVFGFVDGHIHDVSLVATANELLFTADLGGKSDVYAFDLEVGRITRLTDSDYAAKAPAVSPDEELLAIMDYQHERWRLAVIPYEPQLGDFVSEDLLLSAQQMNQLVDQATETRLLASERYSEEETVRYRSWDYLRPRTLYPTLYPTDPDRYLDALADTYLGLGVGLGAEGADPLLRWAYQAEAFYRANRLWGNFELSTTRYRLRPSFNVFRTPTTATARVVGEDGQTVRLQEVGIDQRGASLSLSLPVTHVDNVYQTTSAYSLQSTFRQTQPFERDGGHLGDPTWRATLQAGAALGYRLQQNRRDLHPNTGFVLSATGQTDVWTDRNIPSRGAQSRLTVFLPFLSDINGGVRLNAAMLTQNRGIYATRGFMPRGYETVPLGSGTHARFGAEVTQPLSFIDDGLVLIPFFADVLYAYGFAQTLIPVAGSDAPQRSSLGAGLGLRFRLFSNVPFDIRVAAVYRPEEGSIGWTWR